MPASKSTLWLLAVSLLNIVFVHAEEPKVHQINVILRHGDRTPECFPKRFPNDPHMHESFHPTGPGGLTNEGKRRVYRLGEVLRSRYPNFLSPSDKDHHDSIFGISSETARTKMSLQLLLAGLYPPTADSKWHENLVWQPIPTHSDELINDKFFSQDRCQTFVDELAIVKQLPEVQEKFKSFEPYMEELAQTVGKKSKFNLNDVNILHNNLDIEKRLNLTMLPWMNNVLADERLVQVRKFFYELNAYTDRLKRLQNGPLLRKINEDMFKASADANFARKVTVYSGHDKNIIGLLQSLKIYDGHFPDFTSALIFELWSRDKQYYVKVIHYLGIPEEMTELTIPGCTVSCPLEDYLKLTKDAEIRDDERDCKIHSTSYYTETD